MMKKNSRKLQTAIKNTAVIIFSVFLFYGTVSAEEVKRYTDEDLKQYADPAMTEKEAKFYVDMAAIAISTRLKNPRSFEYTGHKIKSLGGGRTGIIMNYYAQNDFGANILHATMVIFHGNDIEKIVD
jgi:hypothetical protein